MNHNNELTEIKQTFLQANIEISAADLQRLAHYRNQVCEKLQWIEMSETKLNELVHLFIASGFLYKENYMTVLKYAIYSYYILRSEFDIQASDDCILELLCQTFKKQLCSWKTLSIKDAKRILKEEAQPRKERWTIISDFSDAGNQNIFQMIADGLSERKISSFWANALYHEVKELAYECIKYLNYGESTSVSRKEYGHILKTISYMVTHGLASMNEDICLHQHEIQVYFEKGVKCVKQDTLKIRNMMQKVNRERLKIEHERYVSILDQQIPDFLNALDKHDGIFHYCYVEDDLDYPLMDGLPLYHHMYHLQGSDLMLYYLNRFQLENSFCQYFSDEINELFQQYEDLTGMTISDLNLNVCGIVLNQTIANGYLHGRMGILLDKQDADQMKRIKKEDAEKVFFKAFAVLKAYLPENLVAYLLLYKDQFIADLMRFADYEFYMFIYPPVNDQKNVMLLKQPQSSSKFLECLDRLLLMEKVSEKAAYLKRADLSVYDLFDLLDNDIFYGEEYHEFFSYLSCAEVAVMIRVMFPDAYAFYQKRCFDDRFLNEFEPSMQWQFNFIDYLKELNRDEKKKIEEAMNQIGSIKESF